MKKAKFLLLTLLALLGYSGAWAETVSPYTVDFNTAITTSNHDFKVASNWKHIVHRYNDGYSDYFMSYSYKESDGIDNSGALYAGEQWPNYYLC